MADQKKTWFLVPGWDIPPSAIRLGNLIADPTAPHQPLITAATLTAAPAPPTGAAAPLKFPPSSTAPSSITPDSPTIDTEIISVPKTDFKCTLSHSRSHSWGIFAQFLSVFGLGADASISFSAETASSYAFDRLETRWFEPSAAFIQRCVRAPSVQDFLRGASRRTPLYVVTGLKVAEGATVSTAKARTRGYGGKVAVDATSVGVPVSAGPQAESESGVGEELGWSCVGPLVFAYRLKRVVCRAKGPGVKDYNKGALFGSGPASKGADDDVDVYVVEDLPDVEGLGEADEVDEALLESLGDAPVVAASDEADGETCSVVVPEVDEVA